MLLVEDEARIASFLARGLRRGSHTVSVLTEGLPAVRTLTGPHSEHQVLILDLGLPDIDGLEVLRQLRDRGCHIPTVVVTARSAEEDEERARELGVAAFLVKPFPLSCLLECLEMDIPATPGKAHTVTRPPAEP
ncbi:response regulator transcription factor [Aquipuribacter sp. MA13-6]|uniref:response regulator transcription factor n=1 Tax=unclassified Aquipuribacter TaxID=2635084 RepID=UPI003EE9091D